MTSRVASIVAALVVTGAALSLLFGGGQSDAERALEVTAGAALGPDPLAWEEDRRAEFEQRAAPAPRR